MDACELLQYTLDHDLVAIEIDHDHTDHDGLNDIDLSKGIDDEGYTVDGGMCADLVRQYQAGEVANFTATLIQDSGGHPDILSAAHFNGDASDPEVDDCTFEYLATEAADKLRALVDAHRNAA